MTTNTLKILAKSFLVFAMIGGVTVGSLMVTEAHAAKKTSVGKHK